MTGTLWLDWAIMAVSLANMILLLWIGLTVWFNAAQQTWGVWLVAGMALLGSAFFSAHTAILGLGDEMSGRRLDFWWRIGWTPLVLLPFAWYVTTLWYAGFGDTSASLLRRRHQPALVIAMLLLLSMLGLFLFTTSLPSFTQVIQLQFNSVLTLGGVPVLLLVYPLYILVAIGLALDAVLHPAPATYLYGDEARARARPWLVATSGVLLLVSLLIAIFIGWVLLGAPLTNAVAVYPTRGLLLADHAFFGLALMVAWFDLLIAVLVMIVVVLIGQAIVAYEIFTGRMLPHRELQRHWLNAIILAVGYGITIGGSLALHLHFVYSLLLTALLMTSFYALLGWRTFARYAEHIRQLRPFVASQRIYAQLAEASTAGSALGNPPSSMEVDIWGPFYALCTDILHTDYAVLQAVGPLAALVQPPLIYPTRPVDSHSPVLPPPRQWTGLFLSPQTICAPISSIEATGVRWAIPLWSERGLIGVCLLGEKRGGGLYTQEEIEIARATGERLIDVRAGAELARRLLALQRQRLAESQVLDRQTRRVLHDEVLPQLHTALLALDRHSPDATAEATQLLMTTHRRVSDLLHALPVKPAPGLAQGLIRGLQQLMEQEFGQMFDDVTWKIDPGAATATNALPLLQTEVVFYAVRETIRNAARHGRGGDSQRPLCLTVTIDATEELTVIVKDDGVGMDLNAPSAGAGQGVALHSAMLAVIGGSLVVDSTPGVCTQAVIKAPLGMRIY